MARQSSFFDDLLSVASALPWKVSLVLAGVSFFGFHYLAGMPITPPGTTTDLATSTGRQLVRVISLFLQFIVPFVFVLGAFFSSLQSRRQAKLHAQVAGGGDRAALESISWEDFEILTAEVFRRKGFTVQHRGGNAADGGIDLEMWSGKDKYLVQCKQWKANKIGVNIVRELFGVMAAEGAVGGFVVGSGDFTAEASKFARGRSVELVSSNLMLRLIVQTVDDEAASPNCPKCNAPMALRSATLDAMAGSEFWCCSRYPACNGTRQLALKTYS